MPLFDDGEKRHAESMFYKRPSRWNRIRDHRIVRFLADVAYGVHAANGIAHGVNPRVSTESPCCGPRA